MKENVNALLDIKQLSISFPLEQKQKLIAVDNISLKVHRGETIGIVGESGCGKSTLALAIMQLLDQNAQCEGEIHLQDRDLLKVSGKELQKIRGKEVAMIFQDPMTSLNPFYTIGEQIKEQIMAHESCTHQEAKDQTIQLLDSVGINQPQKRYSQYPHEFSGGMRQRVMIAAALSCSPQLLIADEPTTALDVTIQKQIMEIISRLVRERQMGLILITHDLGVVAQSCQKIHVMYGGQFVESGTTFDVFKKSYHPYTRALLQSLPKLNLNHGREVLETIDGKPPFITQREQHCRFAPRCVYAQEKCKNNAPELLEQEQGHFHRCLVAPINYAEKVKQTRETIEINQNPILELKEVCVDFTIKPSFIFNKAEVFRAVDHVSLELYKGETLGLVGESGCGKSTLIRSILQLIKPAKGQVLFKGVDLCSATNNEIQQCRKEMQLVFQDPFSSLNGRMKVFDIIAEPLRNYLSLKKEDIEARVYELIDEVGLKAEHSKRYPHQFSGGQRQRIGIARALAIRPSVLLCDEPISALDVSIQAQIINLLLSLQEKYQLTIIFISHDLSAVKQISDRIAVMYRGKIVELTKAQKIYQAPQHPYTETLLQAIPIPDPEIKLKNTNHLEDTIPTNEKTACSFYDRCFYRQTQCKDSMPLLSNVSKDHAVSCFHPLGELNHESK